jgi:beta-phosphoglucomutase-like phosphatase (HAD superfamily)
LVIEDSNTGAKSAEAAGCTVLVVPNRVAVLDGPRRVFFDGSREHPEAKYFNV